MGLVTARSTASDQGCYFVFRGYEVIILLWSLSCTLSEVEPSVWGEIAIPIMGQIYHHDAFHASGLLVLLPFMYGAVPDVLLVTPSLTGHSGGGNWGIDEWAYQPTLWRSSQGGVDRVLETVWLYSRMVCRVVVFWFPVSFVSVK